MMYIFVYLINTSTGDSIIKNAYLSLKYEPSMEDMRKIEENLMKDENAKGNKVTGLIVVNMIKLREE